MRVIDGRSLSPESLLDLLVADDVLVLRGELCLWTSELLRRLLREHPGLRPTAIDASGLTFVDIAGVRALAEVVARTGATVIPGERLRRLDALLPLERIGPRGLPLG